MIPQVAASERGGAQTACVAMRVRCSRTTVSYAGRERNGLESPAIAGESPLREPEGGVVVS